MSNRHIHLNIKLHELSIDLLGLMINFKGSLSKPKVNTSFKKKVNHYDAMVHHKPFFQNKHEIKLI